MKKIKREKNNTIIMHLRFDLAISTCLYAPILCVHNVPYNLPNMALFGV